MEEFESLQLSINLRNCKEIVKTSKQYAEDRVYVYPVGLRDPPPNFPNGNVVICHKSLTDAILDIRKRSIVKGILVIKDLMSPNLPVVTGENIKHIKSVSASQNPCQFLRDGNVLITSPAKVTGFEWPIVVYDYRHIDDQGHVSDDIEKHNCNMLVRCTNLLYILRDDEIRQETDLLYVNSCKMFESSNEESQLIKSYKSFCTRLLASQKKERSSSNPRASLNQLPIIIMKKSIETIEKETFKTLRDIYWFFISKYLKIKTFSHDRILKALAQEILAIFERDLALLLKECDSHDESIQFLEERIDKTRFNNLVKQVCEMNKDYRDKLTLLGIV